MSAPAASVTLEQTLRDCFPPLGQPPDHGTTWATLAAPLWVTNRATAYNNLLAHRSFPSETSAWSKFMALLGHASIDVPKDAWPTVEAELIAGLAPDAGSGAIFNTPPPNPPKGRNPSPLVLSDQQPLPWSWFKKAELDNDDKGYKAFANIQHAKVFTTMGHQHGELAKDLRQKEVDRRWGFSNKWIKKAESDVLTKRGNLTTKVENFFVKPHGPAANSWEVKVIVNASHKQAAEVLRDEVHKLHNLYTRQRNDLTQMNEVAEQPRRIKTFDIVEKPEAPAGILKYELEPEMYRLRYTLRDKRLKGTDTHLQFLIAQALPRWEKLIEALSALDERLLTFINSPPLLQEAPADASGGTFTARIHKADGSTSFYNEEDLVEEEAGENEDGRSGATRDEGDSSPDGSPDARRMIPFGIVADVINDLVYKEVQFIFKEDDTQDEIDLSDLVDGLNDKTPIYYDSAEIVEDEFFTASNVMPVLRVLSSKGKIGLGANDKITKVH